MQTYHIKTNPQQVATRTVYTADDGAGYIKDGELHLIASNAYYVYKFISQRWYMRNDTAGTDHYLGVGAAPTLNLENIDVKDADYWAQITYTPETTPETNRED